MSRLTWDVSIGTHVVNPDTLGSTTRNRRSACGFCRSWARGSVPIGLCGGAPTSCLDSELTSRVSTIQSDHTTTVTEVNS